MPSVFNVFCLKQRQHALATYPQWALYCLKGPLKGQNEWIRQVDLPVSSLSVHVVKLNHSKFKVNLQFKKDGVQECLQTRGRSQSGSNCSIYKNIWRGERFSLYLVRCLICNELFFKFTTVSPHYKFTCIQSSLCAVLACVFSSEVLELDPRWNATVLSLDDSLTVPRFAWKVLVDSKIWQLSVLFNSLLILVEAQINIDAPGNAIASNGDASLTFGNCKRWRSCRFIQWMLSLWCLSGK